jgi:glycerol-3-phosphate acyltransferase PlsX
MKIGLDIAGGDYAPETTVEGAVLADMELSPDIKQVLIGDQEVIAGLLKKRKVAPEKFEIVHAPDVIAMGEAPTKAFAQKPNSSIAAGFKLLREGRIDAFASAGNTGAMLVGSMYTVRAISGVIRPCITSVLPKEDGGVGIILDVGINSDCKPDVLYQFGILGKIFIEQVYGVKNPKVALLNIGEEEEKGNLVAQAAFGLMKDSKDFSFIGNAEGRDLFNGKADVIVCDGFTGNVVLKEAEAFYCLIKKRKISDQYFDRFNYEAYGGTPILGINANVIIGHGISNGVAVKNMILLAREVVEVKLCEKIKQAFQ